MEYFVHFQNLGTYFAQNVVVLDTLDADLDWTTLEPIYNSHKCKISINPNGVVRYEFSNIHLPWKDADEAGSQGMFSYRIKTKNKNLGTQFKNSASIYFDFNEPIITNTTINTIVAPSATEQLINVQANNLFKIYPNPAQNTLFLKQNISNQNQDVQCAVYDNMGKCVYTNSFAITNADAIKSIDISSFKSGIYIIKLGTKLGVETSKFLKD